MGTPAQFSALHNRWAEFKFALLRKLVTTLQMTSVPLDTALLPLQAAKKKAKSTKDKEKKEAAKAAPKKAADPPAAGKKVAAKKVNSQRAAFLHTCKRIQRT